jgi:hypothetical protein
MSKWAICKGRSKECGDCKHARRHIRESDCDYLVVCRNKTILGFTLTKCEESTAPKGK